MNHYYPVTAMLSNEWKLPFNVAFGIHLLVILGAIFLPGIFKSTPKFADVYSVSIVNIAEPTGAPAPAKVKAQATPPKVKAQAAPPKPVTAPPKPIPKKAVPIAEKQETVEPEPVVQKAISLKPVKKKKIQEVKPPEPKPRTQDLERKKRQQLAAAIREEELLTEQARLAQEALEAERELVEAEQAMQSAQIASAAAVSNKTSSSSTASSGTSNLLESQYLAAIHNRLNQFWAPPEYLQEDPDLTAVVVITINQDGTLADMQFESKSGNRVFDQFVDKTLEDAAPMPPIPPALKKQRFELGLRFKPGSIQ